MTEQTERAEVEAERARDDAVFAALMQCTPRPDVDGVFDVLYETVGDLIAAAEARGAKAVLDAVEAAYDRAKSLPADEADWLYVMRAWARRAAARGVEGGAR